MIKSYKAWLACTLVWLLVGLMYASQISEMLRQTGQAASWHALNLGVGGSLFWVPVTMGFWALAERFPLDNVHAVHLLFRLMVAIAGVVFLRALFVYFCNPILHWYAVLPTFSKVLIDSAQNNLLMVAMLIGSTHGLVYFERAKHAQIRLAQLQSELSKAQLDALSAQLNPHFLFNALNSIAELVHVDAHAADRMIDSLAQLLRKSLAAQPSHTNALADELELLKHYLSIEKIRLAERLLVRWEIQPDCIAAQVPVMILQPLVENAIVHAIAKRHAPGLVRISAERVGQRLRIDIADSGAPESQKELASAAIESGFGLSNTRQRLAQLYGNDFRLELSSFRPVEPVNQAEQASRLDGVTVVIEIPWQTAANPADEAAP